MSCSLALRGQNTWGFKNTNAKMPIATPTLAAEAVIFAINSAIKLSRNLQEAYGDYLQSRELTLPLPDFDGDLSFTTVRQHFRRHPEQLEAFEDLAALHREAEAQWELPELKLRRYEGYYRFFKQVETGAVPAYKRDAVISILRIRQWEQGYLDRQSPLKQVLGTLVEVGIDYFAQVPGALNAHSAHGRLLQQFLSAFDDVNLVKPEMNIGQQFHQRVLPRLFAAAAETVGELSPHIADDEQLQQYIRAVAQQLAQDLYRKSASLRYEEEQALLNWGQLMLRSFIRHAGELAIANPQELFGTNDKMALLAQQTGSILLDALLGDGQEEGPLGQNLSTQTLDELIRASLQLFAEHPGLLSRDRALQGLIEGVAEAVAPFPQFVNAGLMPELLRIAIEQTARNMPSLLPAQQGESRHLASLALKRILETMADTSEDGSWQPGLSRSDLLALIAELLDTIVYYPAWIMEEAAGRPLLSETLRISFQLARRVEQHERLRPEVLQWILQSTLRSVARSPVLLEPLEWGSDRLERALLEHTLDLVFQAVFRDGSSAPPLQRLSLLEEILRYTLEELMAEHPDAKGLALLQIILLESDIDYQRGFDAVLADDLLRAALQAFSAHPQLAANHAGLQSLIADLADALQQAKLKEPGLLLLLVRLLLEQTGENAHLLLDADQSRPEHLLVLAAREVLPALSAQLEDGSWHPVFSPDRARYTLEWLLEQIARHPHWITEPAENGTLVREVLDATLDALATQPFGQRLSAKSLEALLRSSLYATAGSPALLNRIQWGTPATEKSILQHAAELLLSFLFPNEQQAGQHRLHLLDSLLEYIFDALLQRYPDARGLILLDLILFEHNGLNFNQPFDREMADQLAESALYVLEQNPGLISHQPLLRNTVSDLAGALRESGLNRPELLPELVRLTLDNTAHYLDVLMDLEEEDPANQLVAATEQVLRALAKPPKEGRWKPRLSNEQILEIVDAIQWEVILHPEWMQKGLVFLALLDALFSALESVPYRQRLPYRVIINLIHAILRTAKQQHHLIETVDAGEQQGFQLRIRYFLEGLFQLIYEQEGEEEMLWHLSQSELHEPLLDFYLQLLAEGASTPEAYAEALGRVQEALQQWKTDYQQSLLQLLNQP